jgi:hypothetical protein
VRNPKFFHNVVVSVIFLKEQVTEHTVTQNSVGRGGVIPMPGKKGSSLCPSEKELPERHSGTKIPLVTVKKNSNHATIHFQPVPLVTEIFH